MNKFDAFFLMLATLLIVSALPSDNVFAQPTRTVTQVDQFVNGWKNHTWFNPGDDLYLDGYGKLDNTGGGGTGVATALLYAEILEGLNSVAGPFETAMVALVGEQDIDDISASYTTPVVNCADYYVGYVYIEDENGEVSDQDYVVWMRIGVGAG